MSVIDSVKSIATMIKQIDNIEAYRKIIDLQVEVMELVQENNELKQQLAEARSKLAISGELLPGTNSYWKKSGDTFDGPFCTGCWDGNRRLVRMVESHRLAKSHASHMCPVCQNLTNARPPNMQQ